MNLLDTASLVVTPNGYKASKLYSIIPSDGTGDMTFARSTGTATRVNPSGLIEVDAANIPRLDYLGGGCPKLLLEPQRTNLQIKSQEINDATYTKQDLTVVTNDAIAPDGTTTADEVYPTTTGSSRQFFSAFAISTATVYTASLFAKAGGKTWFRMLGINGSGNASFNLADGTVTTISAGFTATINSYGNGWYRCTLTGTSSSTLGYLGAILINSSTDTSIAANGTDGVYFWGLQVEAGAYATSYIPTTTASVTRNGDEASKTSATALIGQTEGTIFLDIDYKTGTNELTNKVVISDGTYNNYFYANVNASNLFSLTIYSGGSNQGASTRTLTAGRHKIALAYKLNDVVLYVDGVLISTDTSATIPACNQINIGSGPFSTSFGLFNSVALWKTRLQNSELATLTSL